MSASFVQINSRPTLYRRIAACATVAGIFAAFAISTYAQSKKPKGPRAIGVVQWRANSKDLAVPVLIPVAILDDGKFYDAGLYKAAPAPMPLLYGFVYEAQDKGELLGYFTIKNQARTETKGKWIALGDFQSAAPHIDDKFENRSQSAEIVRDKSDVPTGAKPGDSGDDRDLKKKSTTVYDENGKEVAADGSATAPSPAAPSTSAKPADADRPTLKRAPGASDDPKSGASAPPKKTEPDDPDRPTFRKKPTAGSTPTTQTTPQPTPQPTPTTTQTASTPSATAPATTVFQQAPDDPDKPKLRRGKPTLSSKADSDPYRPLIRRTAKTEEGNEGLPVPPRVLARGGSIGDPTEEGSPTLKRVRTYEAVAVSDAAADPAQSFRYKMQDDDRQTIEAKLNTLAQAEVDKFLASIGRARAVDPPVKARATGAKSAVKKAAPKPAAPSLFAEAHLDVFDLSHTNDPLFVFSGRERQPGAASNQDAYVTYVVRVDLDGNPRKLFSSVTVGDRLDVTPRMELIDAVDAMGDGKGELLFRRATDVSAEFALYRVTYEGFTELFHGGVAN